MLRFMRNKILIPLVITGALAAFFSFRYASEDNSSNEDRRKMILETVMKAINTGHYSPRPVDDSLSAMIYKKAMDVDYDKRFFTQEDINQLQPYKFKIDDEINAGTFDFYDKMNGIYLKRINDAEAYYKELIEQPFTFTVEEKIELNGEKLNYAANDADLKDRWRKFLKYRTLAKYVDLKKDQDKKKENKDSVNAKYKTDAELEVDARATVRKSMDYYFKRLHKPKDNERFAAFINNITNSEDPHTDYLPPQDKARFDEAMSGTFFGIGAQLRDDEGKVKIVSIIAGSPSWKQGQLKAGDEIQKVGQGAAEPVDVQGYEIDDVVKLIRGKKGTEVRLTVKKVNGAVQVIPIIRGEVLIEEVFAKSAIINGKEGNVGYIYLPEFYSDFQHIDGRRCAEDVALEVMKLKKAGVKGIVLDLRYNGGGSLQDVVDMAGQFVDQGPVVQVKTNKSAPMTLGDTQPGILYDGPMIVMVNQGSASASEIMAAALQDYKRAVIVGSTTFGKGTVQNLKSLDDFANWKEKLGLGLASEGEVATAEPIGSIKMTIQKFYRVNGGSTQLKGVTPDIQLPNPYEMIDYGERREAAALKWDEIPAAPYQASTKGLNTTELAAQSKKRIAANPTFNLIQENAQRIKKLEENNSYSLTVAGYKKELDEANATSKKLEDIEKKVTQLTITNPKDDLARINMDSTTIKKNDEWLKNLKKDIYLAETINIMNDMMRSTAKVDMSTGMK